MSWIWAVCDTQAASSGLGLCPLTLGGEMGNIFANLSVICTAAYTFTLRPFSSLALHATLQQTPTSAIISPYFSASARTYASHAHEDETFEGFTSRYVSFFDAVEDLFELQRGLNNCFAYDLVPAPEVIESALRASRRVNDYSTAVRVFEGIKEKVENQKQYEQYLEVLKPIREELGEWQRGARPSLLSAYSRQEHTRLTVHTPFQTAGITLKEEFYA